VTLSLLLLIAAFPIGRKADMYFDDFVLKQLMLVVLLNEGKDAAPQPAPQLLVVANAMYNYDTIIAAGKKVLTYALECEKVAIAEREAAIAARRAAGAEGPDEPVRSTSEPRACLSATRLRYLRSCSRSAHAASSSATSGSLDFSSALASADALSTAATAATGHRSSSAISGARRSTPSAKTSRWGRTRSSTRTRRASSG
jgi:hypothetical protein